MLKILLLFLLLYSTDSYANNSTPDQEKEIECLAKNIYHEARGLSREEQEVVALVTMNRYYAGLSDTVCGVVYQKSQFSWTRKSLKEHDSKALSVARLIAKKVYYRSSTDFTKGSTYFCERRIRPKWSRYLKRSYVGRNIIAYSEH